MAGSIRKKINKECNDNRNKEIKRNSGSEVRTSPTFRIKS